MGVESIPAIWIGGSLFVGAVLLGGYLTPGYSHTRQSISELGASGAPYGWIVRWFGFVPLGLSFIVFNFQSRNWFSNSIPNVLFLLIAATTITAGIIPTDPGNRRDTHSGKIHARAVMSLMLLLSLAPFLLSNPLLYRMPLEAIKWHRYFSLLVGVVASAYLVLVAARENLPPTNAGFHQRLLLSLHFIWWLVFSQVVRLVQAD